MLCPMTCPLTMRSGLRGLFSIYMCFSVAGEGVGLDAFFPVWGSISSSATPVAACIECRMQESWAKAIACNGCLHIGA
jgi:hypothetical protein